MGRFPKWCSAKCRRRAWERDALLGPDVQPSRSSTATSSSPSDTESWFELIRVMDDQARRGQLLGRQISAALHLVQTAIADQEQQVPRDGYW
jgi:hypothetical protein